jgi:hypothetical protein
VGEGHAGVLARAAETEADHGEQGLGVLFLFQPMVLDLTKHGFGAGLDGAGRQGDQADDRALVLLREEGGRQA